jgi:imidazolonepropionase
MTVLYDNIGELVTNDPAQGDGSLIGLHNDAAMVVDGDHIAWIGSKGKAPAAEHRIDCENRSVIPGFVDSHAHLVFAGDRSAEFAARMSGAAYDGGGIATTVSATRAAADSELSGNLTRLADELLRSGVTTF